MNNLRRLKNTQIDTIPTIDGNVRIVSIRNVATLEQIEDAYGERVAAEYYEGKPRYIKLEHHPLGGITVRDTDDKEYTISEGDVIGKKQCNWIAASMRKAVEQLRKCREFKPSITTIDIQ